MLFRESELVGAGYDRGIFTEIGFDVLSMNATRPFEDFTIKMTCTNQTVLSGSFVPGLSVVYNPKDVNTVIGWNSYVLDNPYDWDGVSNIIVEVWDHSSEDGDMVSIYLNGEPVKEFIELFHKPKSFTFTIMKGHNRLTIRALNEGRSPPNTGSLSVHPEGERAVSQVFSVPEHTSGSMTITLKP